MAKEKIIPLENLEAICKVLGEQNTGTDIGLFLNIAGIDDSDNLNTKWKRLFNAFYNYQTQNNESNRIQIFIQKILSPTRYIGKKEIFEQNRKEVNSRLLFIGIELLENGKFRRVIEAKTISEAEERASNLKKKLLERNVHADILNFCRSELLVENYFHSVFEATKSVADKIREKSGLIEDGAVLVDKAFALGSNITPKLAFNTLISDSEQREHKGFANLLKGFFGMFRNTTGHAPKIKWKINENDALDCLTMASFLHRTLDKCIKTFS